MSDTPAPPPDKKAESDKRARATVEKRLATPAVRGEGTAQTAAGPLSYETHCAYLAVPAKGFDAQHGEPEAAVFTMAYLKKGADPATRGVCFAFNGGPGSASIWLHVGALGPKRVPIPEDGTMPPPPYTLIDNPHTWLAHFDLVFIDPPQTGWSLAASEEARSRFLSVDGDVDAVTEVVRAWLRAHNRFISPLYLAGESYGTTRGAAIADRLAAHGVALSGLILVSCAMDLQTLVFQPNNDLPYALFLPGFACVAQYHGKLRGSLGASPEAARRAAEAFVEEEYLGALHRGLGLPEDRRQRLSKRVAELTGLPRTFVEQRHGRITDAAFFQELLRAEGRFVGRLEARVTAPAPPSGHFDPEVDPGIEALMAPYAMAVQDYFTRGLGLDPGPRYEVFNPDVNRGWNFNRGEAKGNGYCNTLPDLARALRRLPHLRVLVASGHYDLGTPYSASDYTLTQLDVAPETLSRITHHHYDAGHMMYTREADLVRFEADLAAWLQP